MADPAPIDTEYPKMLYRFDEGGIVLHEVPCETRIVASEDDELEAISDGFHATPTDCKPATKEKPAAPKQPEKGAE
jgi:hypothetical protein